MKKNIILIIALISFSQFIWAQDTFWNIKSNSFINSKGEVVIRTNYYWVDDFKDGLARFCEDSICSKSGCIDTDGRVLFTKKNSLYSFSEGLSPYYESKKSRLGFTKNNYSCTSTDYNTVLNNGKLSFINKSGKKEFTPKYKNYIFGNKNLPFSTPYFKEGFAACVIYKDHEPDWYNFIFIDKKGKRSFDQNFLIATNFSEGLAFVVLLNGDKGYINNAGKMVITLSEQLYGGISFSEGFALVNDTSGQVYFINKIGEKLGDITFDKAESFSDGMARVGINDKYGYIDTTGNIVIEPIYCMAADFSGGLAPVSEYIPDSQERIFNAFLIDKKGKKVSPDFKNSTIMKFNGSLAYGVQQGENWNCELQFYINRKGEIVWKDYHCQEYK